MEINGLVACICEGGAEQAILDILLENNLLVFNELLDDRIIRTRSAKEFERKYLRKGFEDKLTIVRILDSRNERFEISKLYQDKISIINIITAPEIEMLIIHCENKYDDYKRRGSKMKPSEYCKNILKMKDVKNYEFIKDYFSNIDSLLFSIKSHKSKSKIPKGEQSLIDILNINV